MEVKPGYKQTEVGVIPEAWGVTEVKDVTRSHKQGFYTKDSYVSNGVRLVRITDLMNPRVDYGAMPMLRISCGDLDLYKIKRGDFLFARSGAIGRYGIVCEDVEAVFGSYIIRFAFDSTQLNTEYFGFLYETEVVWRQLSSITQGSSNININASNIKSIQIPLPPLHEQRAIAGALGEVDALIGALDQLFTKNRDLKQGALQQLLTGKTRLPGFETKRGYKQTEVGGIPGNWETATLSALSSMKSGEGITSTNIDQFSKYPCYGGNGLRGFTTRFTHDGRYALVGRQGALCGNVLGVEGKFFASEHAIVVTASPRTDIRWLTFVLGEMHLNQYSESSAQPGLSVSKILSLNIACPPSKAEQTAIAKVLSDMDAELAALEQRRDKTRSLKQGMMQELLTGRTRLV